MADTIHIWQVDAFAEAAYAGNPAAVCPLQEERSDVWMQALAAEMNLSETAFVRPIQDGFALRWFTRGELDGIVTDDSVQRLFELRG